MPIYAYQCEACGHELEVLQKISEQPLKDCPACSRPALRKQVTAAAFRLKGTGWYETDFKGGKKPEKKPDGGDKSADGASKDGAKDKPATKAKESTASSSTAKSSDA